MSWRPHIGTPDPASAWFSDRQLAEHRRADQQQEAFAQMIEHRNRFEDAVRQLNRPTPHDLQRLWRETAPEGVSATTSGARE
jgi:hypothetical protein